MRRREFIRLVGNAVAVWPIAAHGQRLRAGKIVRIGMLETTSIVSNTAGLKSFRQSLLELGYIEGQSFLIEYRSADGHAEKFAQLAVELVGLKVDLIMTRGTPAALAAKNATSTIPVVMTAIGDPILAVNSLAHPGGNLTGLSSFVTDLMPKRIELLKEAVPGLERISVLLDMSNASEPPQWVMAQTAAQSLGLRSDLFDIRKRDDFKPAFDMASRQRGNALVFSIDTVTQGSSQLIVDLAAQHRLPAIYASREFADAGGLMTFGVNYPDLYRRAAVYVDKILKGSNPADLPIEQPTKFELVINVRAAKALGIEIPPTLIIRADEVIE
jgi:putative tryptophan/tyrosine transport system substrate-binding protein